MTYRELRQVLTDVENQEMTVKELRDILFEVEEQDEEVSSSNLTNLTCEKPMLVQTFAYTIFKARDYEEPEQITDEIYITVMGRSQEELFKKAGQKAYNHAAKFGEDFYYDDFKWSEPTKYFEEV